MPYLHKVIQESLRVCPPIPVVVRRASEDLTIRDFQIPKGVRYFHFSTSYFYCFYCFYFILFIIHIIHFFYLFALFAFYFIFLYI